MVRGSWRCLRGLHRLVGPWSCDVLENLNGRVEAELHCALNGMQYAT